MAISNNNTGIRTGVCTSSTRPTAPYEGQHIYETDTDLTFIWGGSAWQQVSGGTAVGNSGLVYITSATMSGATVNISNCFTSTYKQYFVQLTTVTNAGTDPLTLQLLKSGTAAAGNNYNRVRLYVQATVGSQTSVNQDSLVIGYFAGQPEFWNIDFFNPQVNTTTRISAVENYMDSSVLPYIDMNNGYHTVSDSYDGFRLYSNGNSFTSGTVTVYGRRSA